MKYFEALRKMGATRINRSIDIPDIRLGVGKAENLKTVPIKVSYALPNNAPVVIDPSEQAYEKTAYNGVSDGVDDSAAYLGADANSLWDIIEAGRAR